MSFNVLMVCHFRLLAVVFMASLILSSCGNGRIIVANADIRQTLASAIFDLDTGMDASKWTPEQIATESWRITPKWDEQTLKVEPLLKSWSREGVPNVSRMWCGSGNFQNLTNVVVIDVQVVDSVVSKDDAYASPVVAFFDRRFANFDPYKPLLVFSGIDGKRSGYYYLEDRFIPKSIPTRDGKATKWIRVRIEFHIDENNHLDFENKSAQKKIKDMENSVLDDLQGLLIALHCLVPPKEANPGK